MNPNVPHRHQLSKPPLMSRTALPYRQKVRSEVAIFSQNVNRNYGHVETTLAVLSESSDIDIYFIQEPPWNIIRAAPSTTRKEGDDMIGAPLLFFFFFFFKLHFLFAGP